MRTLITLSRYQILCILVTPFRTQTRGRYDTPRAPRIRALLYPRRTSKEPKQIPRESQSRLLLHLLAPEETLPLLIVGTHSFERVSGNPRGWFRDLIRLGMIQRVMECVWLVVCDIMGEWF
ncbi:hypothetical protein CDAR_18901 [Caerostris darwini]|uniref:Secreted protein n=1 Tax=Caerostris darwini TaxID=1538125 RepID=A0AAV4WCH1_9ARAC|nr:hypothetical protein CDAR_18901 [Caerostris darwini]